MPRSLKGYVYWMRCKYCKEHLLGTDNYDKIFSSYKEKELEKHEKECQYNPELILITGLGGKAK